MYACYYLRIKEGGIVFGCVCVFVPTKHCYNLPTARNKKTTTREKNTKFYCFKVRNFYVCYIRISIQLEDAVPAKDRLDSKMQRW